MKVSTSFIFPFTFSVMKIHKIKIHVLSIQESLFNVTACTKNHSLRTFAISGQ